MADPVQVKENLRLDSEQKNRLLNKVADKVSDNISDDYSDISSGEDKENAFITQKKEAQDIEKKAQPQPKPQPKIQSNLNKKSIPDKDEEPKKMQKPKADDLMEYEDEDCELLHRENENLIKQLSEFTSQMDSRMILLKKSKKDDEAQEERPSSAMNSRKSKLDSMARKMKLIKSDIENMQRILDNSYKIDTVVDKENKSKEQDKILETQNLKLKDYKKAIRDQKKFMKEMEQLENAGSNMEGIDNHFREAKDKVRQLKKQFTEEDKRLRDQHEESTTFKERCRKIRDYIQEKKRIEAETGEKQAVTQNDLDAIEQNIAKLEDERKDIGNGNNKLQLQDDRIIRVQHEANQMELKLKEKENEYRMINLKIKELKRTIQGTYVHKATNNSREERKKSAKSVNKTNRPPKKSEPEVLRPSSSKKGLADTIKKETEKERKEFIMPVEKNTVTRGVDFNGGDDEPFDREYSDEEFEEVNTKPFKKELDHSERNTQEETFRGPSQQKEYYSRKANENMAKESINAKVDTYADPINPPPNGNILKPNLKKITSKPNIMPRR